MATSPDCSKTAGSEENSTEVSVPAAFNPSVDVTDLKDEDLEKMKGDAIGDTLYSERFVLNTLLKLTNIEKDLSEDEEFEKDLCNLWDMTIEKDVVKLLLNHKVLEIFSSIVRDTEDKRLTEILIGIIGNMCNLSETREQLCSNAEVMGPIIDLISCSDSLTLIQLMRLFHVSLVFENTGDETIWFQHFRNSDDFVEYFSFILNNSINKTLLVNALEALNAICAKFAVIEIQPDVKDMRFCDVFVKECLISGVMEAFKTLLPPREEKNEEEKDETETHDDTLTPTQNSKKIMSLFLDLNVILSQYEEVSKKCYEPIIHELMHCISQTLTPLCQPIYLLPLTFNEQGIIENLNEISLAIGDPFDEKCFVQMATIWNLIEDDRIQKEKDCDEWSNDIDSEADVNAEDICMTILEFITRTVRNATNQQIKNSLKLQSSSVVKKLLNALSAGDSEDDINDCCLKIKSNLEEVPCEITENGTNGVGNKSNESN